VSTSLRKAAILIRTLDADTAAGLLSQLSPVEAKEVRLAIQALGEVDDDERADVSAEFRRSGAVAAEDPMRGVELDFSSPISTASYIETSYETRPSARPFEFLEHARVESLVPYLSREHAQTVAVVLSYLAPSRAAQVLAALPEKLQADAIERLSILGSTDPDTLQVLERELADWVARQQATRTRPTQRTETVAAILAAADGRSRGEILANLLKHNRNLADQLAPKPIAKPEPAPIADLGSQIADSQSSQSAIRNPQSEITSPPIRNPQPEIPSPPLPRIHIDDLARFDQAALAAVLQSVDAEVLTLALVGASESLIARITDQLPRKSAKAFRQRLVCVGPTRLRDVEAAQHEVTQVAAHIIHHRRTGRRAA
jgi:flagellar motor switch protein FliG